MKSDLLRCAWVIVLTSSFLSCTDRAAVPDRQVDTVRLSPNDSFLVAKHSPPEYPALPYAPAPFADRLALTWEGDVYSELTITWRSDTGYTRMELQYAKEGSGADFRDEKQTLKSSHLDIDGISYTSRYHKARLHGLEPGEQYAYRVGADGYWSEWSNFSVPNPGADRFKFIYMGDAQNDLYDTWTRVMRRAFTRCPDASFVLHAGDLINHADNDYEWAEFFAGTEPFNKSIPIIVTPGNHEYVKDLKGEKISFSKYWNPQFNFPENGPEGFEDQVYYTDYGNARIISLNSNRDIEAQAAWLDEVLSENPHTWSIVTFHHPVYSGSKGRYNEGVNQHWRPILDKHRVDLVLQGHDHTYARGTNFSADRKKGEAMKGSLYVVSVSGRKQYDLEIQPWMDRYGKDLQLYQVLDVAADAITYKAYTADDVIFDEVRIEKVPDGPNLIFSKF